MFFGFQNCAIISLIRGEKMSYLSEQEELVKREIVKNERFLKTAGYIRSKSHLETLAEDDIEQFRKPELEFHKTVADIRLTAKINSLKNQSVPLQPAIKIKIVNKIVE